MIENFLKKNKWINLVLVVLIVFYVNEDVLILGMPMIVSVVMMAISGIIALAILFYFSNRKKKNELLQSSKTKRSQKPKKNDGVKKATNFLGAVFLSVMVYAAVSLLFDLAVSSHAKSNRLVSIIVPIDSYVHGHRGRNKGITFYFEGAHYQLPFDAEKITADDLKKHYKLKMQYSRSYFNSAVIDNWDVVKK